MVISKGFQRSSQRPKCDSRVNGSFGWSWKRYSLFSLTALNVLVRFYIKSAFHPPQKHFSHSSCLALEAQHDLEAQITILGSLDLLPS